MQTPEGYTLSKCLLDSRRKALYVGRRESDGSKVLLKVYPQDASVSQEASRAGQEFRTLRSLPPGVGPQALALELTEEAPVLVLEFVPGAPVQGPVSARDFLSIALQASQTLARLHTERRVHRGLGPSALLVEAPTQKVRLVGFGNAAPLGAPVPLPAQPEHALAEALFYMPPEQTGRIERGIDFRTDLYALGATLYELLCGRPPFDARDPLDLIHAHIAHRPRTPTEVRSSVPGTLSRIVMKLLEKEPEDRYQTAEALHVDLESCLEQLERTGTIDDELPLGAADAPYRPLFRRRIYGRADECRELTEAYARARGGSVELVLVRGAPGIGKSALVPELHRPLALDGGYLARGKLDLYRGHLPYAGFVSALRSLVSQIVSESESRRNAWREALSGALGRLSGVAVELVPELGGILGEVSPAAPLDAQAAQQRLRLTVRRLVEAAACHAAPLVLFLDDVQWADAGSRDLLQEIVLVDASTPLLVIASYRDNEVDATHPLTGLLERIAERGISTRELSLGPLSPEAVSEMLGDALEHSPDSVRDLVEAVTRACGSNPLLIQQAVYHLHQVECIQHGPGGWTYDVDRVESAVVSADPVGMMLARLQRLGGESRAVAQLASCIGDEFDLGLLEELSGRARSDLEAALYDLSDEGLISPCRGGFRFVHDRVREAAQRLVPESERAQLHYRTASLLIQRLPEAAQRARCFEISDHLVRSGDCVPSDQRIPVAQRHRDAGLVALGSGAFATAHHYFAVALQLLGDDDWAARPELTFQVAFHVSMCAFQLRRFQEALDLLDRIERAPLGPLQQGLVAAQRVAVYCESRPLLEAMEVRAAALRRFGDRSPRNPSWLRTRLALAALDRRLRRAPETWPFRPGSGDLPLPVAIQLMIRRASGRVSTAASARLACFSTAGVLRDALRCGFHDSPGRLIAGFATIRRAFLRSSAGLDRYVSAARLWLERAPGAGAANAWFYIHAAAEPWLRPRRGAVEPLREVAEALAECGEVVWETSAWLMRANYAALSGASLDDVVGYFDAIRNREDMTPVESPRTLVRPYHLLGDPEARFDFSEVWAELEQHAESAQFAATHWMLALCVLGCASEVWRISELVAPVIFERQAAPAHVIDYTLFRGLAAAELAREAGGDTRRMRRAAARCERDLRRAARYGPDFVHMADFVSAEREWTRRRDATQALARFEAVVGRAEEIDYVHHAALARERCAAILAASGQVDESRAQLARARSLYERWGANAKVRALDAATTEST